MRRPAGFDARTETEAETGGAAVDGAADAGRRRWRRRTPSPASEHGAADHPTEGGETPAPEPTAAARVGRQLRDAVLPQRADPEERAREVAARRRPREEPEDREARAEARRAARRARRFEKRELRRFTRRSRRRKIMLLVAAGTAVTMAGLVAIAVYSPLLALRTITVDGTSRIDAADIHDAVDGQLGTPLALLDDGRLTEELGDFPLIRSFVTETLPPDTLAIHIVERQPIGSLPTATGFALVDPAGIVIERSSARIPGVPLIDIGGEDADSDAFDAAVEVLVALPDPILGQLDTITATTKDDVRLAIASTGATIVWGGAERSDYKAQVLASLLANVPTASEFNVSAPGQGTYKP